MPEATAAGGRGRSASKLAQFLADQPTAAASRPSVRASVLETTVRVEEPTAAAAPAEAARGETPAEPAPLPTPAMADNSPLQAIDEVERLRAILLRAIDDAALRNDGDNRNPEGGVEGCDGGLWDYAFAVDDGELDATSGFAFAPAAAVAPAEAAPVEARAEPAPLPAPAMIDNSPLQAINELERLRAILQIREAELAQLKGLDAIPEVREAELAQTKELDAILEVREAEIAQLKGLDHPDKETF